MSLGDVSNKLGSYLLKGWTMLASSCVEHPSVPLMREPKGTKCICVLCDDRYYVEDGENLLMYMKSQPKQEEKKEEIKEEIKEEPKQNKMKKEIEEQKKEEIKETKSIELLEEKKQYQLPTMNKEMNTTQSINRNEERIKRINHLENKINELINEIIITPPEYADKIQSMSLAIVQLKKAIEVL